MFDNVNPYHIDLFNTEALANVNKNKQTKNNESESWLENASLDPRVLQAVGTIHKHGYNSWENFIYDFDNYKDDPRVFFTDFSVRMELSLRKYISDVKQNAPQEKNKKREAKLADWKEDYEKCTLDSKLDELMKDLEQIDDGMKYTQNMRLIFFREFFFFINVTII